MLDCDWSSDVCSSDLLTDCNLTAANLSYANLHAAIITGANMDRVEKIGIDLSDIITSRNMGKRLESLGKTLPELLETHTTWIKTGGRSGKQLDLSGYDLSEIIDLRLSPLTAIRANGTNFIGQNLTDAAMQSANFDKADLRDCNLQNADLRASSFKYARFARANLSGAKLNALTFELADGTKRLSRTDLSGAMLRYAVIHKADLRDCIFMGADLRGSSLIDCDLRGADFTGAILDGTTIKDSRLDKTIIDLSEL
jgi:uncharacterized protein YjbI with pentapeptide repeats